MSDPLQIGLRYSGPTVDSGTMPIDEVVEALQGFSGAYSKIAARYSPESEHQLKVAALERGSFDIKVIASAVLMSTTYADQLKAVDTVTNAAKFVWDILFDVFRTKKHVKDGHHNVVVSGNGNTVVVVNAQGSSLHISPQAFEVFKDKLIDADCKKIVDPLEEGRVTAAELIEAEEGERGQVVTVNVDERDYFVGSTTVTSKPAELIGKFLSLNIERNTGTFRLGDQTTVRYRYVGKHKELFHAEFSRGQLVKVSCVAEFDDNLKPSNLKIERVHTVQRTLGLTVPTSETDN